MKNKLKENMITNKKDIAFILFIMMYVAFVLFLIGSFINLSFDSTQWDKEFRELFVILWLCSCGALFGTKKILKDLYNN